MAGVSFDLLIGMMFFLIAVWGSGRMFRMVALPAILGEFLAGVLLGPNFLDVVPYASNGECDTIIFPNDESGSSSAQIDGRMLAGSYGGPPCKANLVWTPRWTISDTTIVGKTMHTPDIWSFMGTVGVTLLIMESGMHINFEKVKQIGGQALIVAIVGTTAPLVLGMLLVGALFGQDAMYPDGFAAGCALAPTSVGISIKLLSDAKMLNSMAGQTTLTGTLCHTVLAPKTRADPTDSWGSLLTQPTDPTYRPNLPNQPATPAYYSHVRPSPCMDSCLHRRRLLTGAARVLTLTLTLTLKP